MTSISKKITRLTGEKNCPLCYMRQLLNNSVVNIPSVVKPLSLTLCPVLTLFGLSFVFFHSVRRKNFIFTLIWTCVRTFFTNLVCYLPCFARRDEHLINCSFSFRKPLPIYHLTQSSTVFPLLSSPFQQGTRFLLCA